MLARLHQLGEAPASEIRTALQRQRPLSHASVMTLLGRLETRGLVARRKADRGKAFLFRPVAPEKVYGGVLQRLVERVFANDPVALVASLFGDRKPTADQVQRLEDLLSELQARERGGRE